MFTKLLSILMRPISRIKNEGDLVLKLEKFTNEAQLNHEIKIKQLEVTINLSGFFLINLF